MTAESSEYEKSAEDDGHGIEWMTKKQYKLLYERNLYEQKTQPD